LAYCTQPRMRDDDSPHDLTWAWTRAAAVGIRRLTAWAMARPLMKLHSFLIRLLFYCYLS
jgi:hypothetical protein